MHIHKHVNTCMHAQDGQDSTSTPTHQTEGERMREVS